jgi:hypothetical protein
MKNLAIWTFSANSDRKANKESVFKVSSFLNCDLQERFFILRVLYSFCSPLKLGKVGTCFFGKRHGHLNN